jgi:hypothetical protein
METLTAEQTHQLRAAQKKRSRVIALLILIWIAGLFTLTLVKGHQAEDQRIQNEQHG